MVQQSDQTTINSSIALLQRRFRELERMKILRQEKELMRMLLQQSEEKYHHHQIPKFLHRNHHYHHKKQPSKSKVHQLINHEPDVEVKHIPSIQLSLSLWPETEKKQPGIHRSINVEAPSSPLMTKSLLINDRKTFEKKWDIKIDESFCDVDTSLHL
ncbi:hypothetical protein LIER_37194 [Lithospermum erythrorhizon]|uniref:Uncharacterized protein n=1 Tax=Lithospermum erythrorhizon TaxID=34254 RepID=A0AAV3PGV0_LITER